MRKLVALLLAMVLLTACSGEQKKISNTPTIAATATPGAWGEQTPPPTPDVEHLEEILDAVKALYSGSLTVDSIDGRASTTALSIVLETSSLAELFGRCIANEEDAWAEWDSMSEDMLTVSAGLREIMNEYNDRRIISVQILSVGGASYWTFTPEKVLYNGVDPIKEKAAAAAEKEAEEIRRGEEQLYILNTSTKVFHYSTCSSVDKIKDKNKSNAYGTREEMIARGYKSCGNCHP